MPVPASGLERLLRRDGAIVITSLIALVLLAWLYLLVLSMDMARGDMSPAAAMDAQTWGLRTFVLMLLMWAVMMVGMMVPSAAPMILLFVRVQRQRLAHENPILRGGLFTLGYVVIWVAFSAAATLLQWFFATVGLISPTMVGTSRLLGAAIFAAAGLYQFFPLKLSCLKHCRSPINFLSTHWRNGNFGALRMGLDHGGYCVGCCWFLMALLFVGGVMNLLWVAAIAAFVLLEKIVPTALWVSRASGIAMLGFSTYLLAQIF